jgi:hypothetical protein
MTEAWILWTYQYGGWNRKINLRTTSSNAWELQKMNIKLLFQTFTFQLYYDQNIVKSDCRSKIVPPLHNFLISVIAYKLNHKSHMYLHNATAIILLLMMVQKLHT